MGIHKNKAETARLITFLLERERTYSAEEIDSLVRDTVLFDRLNAPHYAADHIRLAMIENGFVVRDAAGTAYRVHPEFQLPAENERMNQNSLSKPARPAPPTRFSAPLATPR